MLKFRKHLIFLSLMLVVLISALFFLPCKKLAAENSTNKEKIEQAQKEEDQYSKQVEDVESKLLAALSELESLNAAQSKAKSEADRIAVDLTNNGIKVDDLGKELDKKMELLNLRIAEIYKSSNNSYFEVLVKAESFNEFISKLKLMNVIVKKDIELIDEIKVKRADLLKAKNDMIDLRESELKKATELETLIKQANAKKAELQGIYDEKSELLTVAKANKEALIAMENQLEAKETEISQVLESYSYGNAPTSGLLWPTNGRISSGFGYRTSSLSGTTRMHKGVDIYAPNGTPIIAAESGQVISAKYDGGYGYAILIYHGGGFATFYAHMSGFAVSPGQTVQKGQTIGYVGTTGYTTGPHLHFEVRINGAVQNPMNFF
jgi:murein DD-endopeptidase MepM/ murein hydrolase activator NlpD